MATNRTERGFSCRGAKVCHLYIGDTPYEDIDDHRRTVAAAGPVGQRRSSTKLPVRQVRAIFKAYAESAAVQKAFTVYPLAHILLDHSSAKPRQIKVALPQAKLSFPLLPSAAKRKAEKLDFRVDAVEGDMAQATIYNTERGYQKAYFFKKTGCWKLELVEDRSL